MAAHLQKNIGFDVIGSERVLVPTIILVQGDYIKYSDKKEDTS